MVTGTRHFAVTVFEGEGPLDGHLEVRVRLLGQSGGTAELVHSSARKDLGDAQAVTRAASRCMSSVLLELLAPELSDAAMEEVAG